VSDNRTHKATPKRVKEFRKRGDIALSRDLVSAAPLAGGTIALIAGAAAGGFFLVAALARPGGMGMGLAISRTLAKARGGDLSFGRSSTLGGACFKLRLPIEAP